MKIAITGPGGSGKTTLLRALMQEELVKELKLAPLQEVTRTVRELGFPINEAGADETQLMITATHIQNVLAKDDYIVDRCLLDGFVYTEYLYLEGKVASYIAEFTWQLLKRHFKSYDAVFYIPNEFAVEADGVRSTEVDFQEKTSGLFKEALDRLEAAGVTKNVYRLSGSVESRTQQVLAVLKEKAAK